MKKNEIQLLDNIKILKIYKEYPTEIENDVPEVLVDYYGEERIFNTVNWENILSYGYMFKQFRKRNQYLAEFKCLDTGKTWFGGIAKRAFDITDTLKTPTFVKKYIHEKPKLLLIEGFNNDNIYIDYDYRSKEINFKFNSGDFISDLNKHLKELKKFSESKEYDLIILNKWYLEELNKIREKNNLNYYFKSEIELQEFLIDFEEKIHNLFDYNKLLITLDNKREDYLSNLIKHSHESRIEVYQFEIEKIILEEDSSETSKTKVNSILKTSNNIYQQALKNEFFLNYITKIPCNTYSKIGNDFFNINNVIQEINSKKRITNRYKISWTEFTNYYTDDDYDIDYFGEDFLFYGNNKIKDDYNKETTKDDKSELGSDSNSFNLSINF